MAALSGAGTATMDVRTTLGLSSDKDLSRVAAERLGSGTAPRTHDRTTSRGDSIFPETCKALAPTRRCTGTRHSWSIRIGRELKEDDGISIQPNTLSDVNLMTGAVRDRRHGI